MWNPFRRLSRSSESQAAGQALANRPRDETPSEEGREPTIGAADWQQQEAAADIHHVDENGLFDRGSFPDGNVSTSEKISSSRRSSSRHSNVMHQAAQTSRSDDGFDGFQASPQVEENREKEEDQNQAEVTLNDQCLTDFRNEAEQNASDIAAHSLQDTDLEADETHQSKHVSGSRRVSRRQRRSLRRSLSRRRSSADLSRSSDEELCRSSAGEDQYGQDECAQAEIRLSMRSSRVVEDEAQEHFIGEHNMADDEASQEMSDLQMPTETPSRRSSLRSRLSSRLSLRRSRSERNCPETLVHISEEEQEEPQDNQQSQSMCDGTLAPADFVGDESADDAIDDDIDDEGQDVAESLSEYSSDRSSLRSRLSQRLSRRLSRTRHWVQDASRSLRNNDETVEVSWQCMSVSAISDFWEGIANNVVAPNLKLFRSYTTEESFSIAHLGSKRRANSNDGYDVVTSENAVFELFGFNSSRGAAASRNLQGLNPRTPSKRFTFDRSNTFDHDREMWTIRDVVDHVLIPLENKFKAPVVNHLGDGSHDASEGIFVLVDQSVQFESLVRSLKRLCKLRDIDPKDCYVWLEAFGVHHMLTGLPLGKENDKSRVKRFYQYEVADALKRFHSTAIVLDDNLNGYRDQMFLYNLSQIGAQGLQIQAVWPTRGTEDSSAVSYRLGSSYEVSWVYQHVEEEMGIDASRIYYLPYGQSLPSLIVDDMAGPRDRNVSQIRKNARLALDEMFFEFTYEFAESQLAKMSTISEAQDLTNAVSLYAAIERYTEAFNLAERTLAKLSDLSDEVSEAVKHGLLASTASVFAAQDKVEEAVSYYQEAITACNNERYGMFLTQYAKECLALFLKLKGRETEGWDMIDKLLEDIQHNEGFTSTSRHHLLTNFVLGVGEIAQATCEFSRAVRYYTIARDSSVAYEEETDTLDYMFYSIATGLLSAMCEESSDEDVIDHANQLMAWQDRANAETFFAFTSVAWSITSMLLGTRRCSNFVLETLDTMQQSGGSSFFSWETPRKVNIVQTLLILGRTKEAIKGLEELESDESVDQFWGAQARRRDFKSLHAVCSARIGRLEEALDYARSFVAEASQFRFFAMIDEDNDNSMLPETNQARITLLRLLLQSGRIEEGWEQLKLFERYVKTLKPMEDDSVAMAARAIQDHHIISMQSMVIFFRGMLARLGGDLEKSLKLLTRSRAMYTSITGSHNLANIDASLMVVHTLIDLDRFDEAEEVFESLPRLYPVEEPYYHKVLVMNRETAPETSDNPDILQEENESVDDSTLTGSIEDDHSSHVSGQNVRDPELSTRLSRSSRPSRSSRLSRLSRSSRLFSRLSNSRHNQEDHPDETQRFEVDTEHENGRSTAPSTNEERDDLFCSEASVDPNDEVLEDSSQSEGTALFPDLQPAVTAMIRFAPNIVSNEPEEYKGAVSLEALDADSLSKVGLDGQFALIEGRLSLCRGDLDRYVEIMRDIAEAQGIYSGLDSALYATASLKYVKALRITRRYAEALSLAEEVLSILRSIEGPDSLLLGDAVGESAILHARVGDVQEALALSAEAILLIRERIPDSVRMGYALFARGIAQAAAGHLADGESSVEHGIDIMMKCHGGESSSVAYGLHILAKMSDDADVAREAANIYTSCLGADHPFTQRAEQLLATLCK